MSERAHPVDLLPAHALGALEADEAAAVEAHVAGCPECAHELAGWRRTAEEVAGAAPPVAPSAELRRRVLAATIPLATSGASGETRRGRSPLRWLPAAAALAALALASWSLARQARLAGELDQALAESRRLASDQRELRGELARTRGRVAELSSTLELVSSPATRRIALAGLGPAPGAGGTTLVDPARGTALFTARGLPEPPAGRTYQLWYITAERGPVSAGTFAVDDSGRGEVTVAGVPPPESIQVWAVTVEPEGGVPQPTGEMVLRSS